MTLVARNTKDFPILLLIEEYVNKGNPNLQGPIGEVEADETPLGTVSREIRQLWHARELANRELKRKTMLYLSCVAELEADYKDGKITKEDVDNNTTRRGFSVEVAIAEDVYEALDRITWASVRFEFPSAVNCVMRANWTVCSRSSEAAAKDELKSALLDIFKLGKI